MTFTTAVNLVVRVGVEPTQPVALDLQSREFTITQPNQLFVIIKINYICMNFSMTIRA